MMDLMNSDKVKYQKALALQKLARDPDAVFVELKYHLAWMAPDHVHIYLESDGEKSIEKIVRKLKRVTSKSLLKKFPELKAKLDDGSGLWDEAYFSETLG